MEGAREPFSGKPRDRLDRAALGPGARHDCPRGSKGHRRSGGGAKEEKNVISTALAIGLVATEGIGEWKSTREVMLAVFERMRPDSQAQGAHLDAARELLETREQLGHVVEA